jgi:glycosyltransferase involved in cell wall biosynthesis
MKILLVLRLYSGFESSVHSGKWEPSGVPTIYKLIESLDTGPHEISVILTSKQSTSISDSTFDRELRIKGLNCGFLQLAGEAKFPNWLGRLRWYACELRQTWKVWRACRRSRPNIIYIDRGNLVCAGILARFGQIPVVYRIMGISSDLRDSVAGYRPRHVISRWLLRAPFSAAICTQDGTGGEIWLDRLLSSRVPKLLYLNGVDLPDDPVSFECLPADIPQGSTVVLFTGRLEAMKGCSEFVEAFLRARQEVGEGLHAVIVGTGSMLESLRERVAEAGAMEIISFLGVLPHSQVLDVCARSDIYVSLNRMANLSNATLEALRAGCCVVMPSAQPEIFADLWTEEHFPPDMVVRIPRVDDIDALADRIVYLHRNPDERDRCAAASRQVSQELIPTWSQRIAKEIRVLQDLAASKPLTQEEVQQTHGW